LLSNIDICPDLLNKTYKYHYVKSKCQFTGLRHSGMEWRNPAKDGIHANWMPPFPDGMTGKRVSNKAK
jgi:hypothetical protein